MGNVVTLVLSYRLNKDHIEKIKENKQKENKESERKENICSYLYGKCNIKNVRIPFTSNQIFREEKSGKNI
jgi:hypothetical protein